eukprot:5572701-Amphidinium_carterae.1
MSYGSLMLHFFQDRAIKVIRTIIACGSGREWTRMPKSLLQKTQLIIIAETLPANSATIT